MHQIHKQCLNVASMLGVVAFDEARPQRVAGEEAPDLHFEMSLALHKAVAARLDDEMVARARCRTMEWLNRGGTGTALLARWREILELPLEDVRTWLTDPSEEAAWLRKASPFAGEIAPREREQIIRETRRRLRMNV